MALISVIVPVYNAEKTLRRCVDSILSQEFQDFELLLIDDGSKDESPAICDEYAKKDRRVQVFHKENGGVSSARNIGLDEAKGEWIVFVDSDDYISNNYLSVLYDCDSDIAFMQYSYFNINGYKALGTHINEIPEVFGTSEIPLILEKRISTMMFRCPNAMAFKSRLIGNIRFNEQMKVAEDANFVHRCLINVNTARCYNCHYYYNIGENAADVKYSCTVDYAVSSLMFLKESYMLVVDKWGIGRRNFYSYLIYFKAVSKSDWVKDPSLWYDNQKIKIMYDYVWPDLTFIQKTRFVFARLLKK